MQGKIERYEEEKKMGGLTQGEIAEATDLMVKAGEIDDPNAKAMG